MSANPWPPGFRGKPKPPVPVPGPIILPRPSPAPAPVVNVHVPAVAPPKVTGSQLLAGVLAVALVVLGAHDYTAHHRVLPPVPVPVPPAPAGPLRVLFVYDSAANLSAGQLNALYSMAVRKYLDDHCPKDPDGTYAWRAWDKDVNTDGESDVWRNAWTAAKPMLGSLPQVVIFHGQKGKAFPLPDSEKGLLDLLAKEGAN